MLAAHKKTLRDWSLGNQQQPVFRGSHGVGQTTTPTRTTTVDSTRILFLRVWLGLFIGKHLLFANAFKRTPYRPIPI